MSDNRGKLLKRFYNLHRKNLSLKIIKVSLAYLIVSVMWNFIFQLMNLPYSRADLPTLLLSVLVLLFIVAVNRFYGISPMVLKHVVLSYIMFVVCCLYFASGYKEAWTFFLMIPLISALYGKLQTMLIYSGIGLLLMMLVSAYYPLYDHMIFDSIDISNRLLIYLIIATISYILLEQLIRLYHNQVNIILESTDSTIEQVVKSFIVSIEAKDAYTFGHSERVSRYAVELAKLLPEFQQKGRLKSMRLAGLLHDIGKINIPESVLSKPDKLTDEEYELVKTHPVIGGRMVEKISSLDSLKDGVLYHHERWDGRGYPSGLAGEEIPLDARILAMADAFDAMTSSRAYREALPVSEAFKRIREGRGTQFDPNLVDCLDVLQVAWLRIHKQSQNEMQEFETMTDLF
ncbi:HD-GYP domain-containing protein [Xylanibacillus composti]|nr:HD-GYP domain-containing protein [Xylanibacillus composti]MDT9725653.1 HD-GYP domain-containing protein [Xylanibacillus composti]